MKRKLLDAKITKEEIKEIEDAVRNPPRSVIDAYKKSIEELNKGLPVATSGEVLNSRADW